MDDVEKGLLFRDSQTAKSIDFTHEALSAVLKENNNIRTQEKERWDAFCVEIRAV